MDNITKDNRMDQGKDYRPYCFPDIPVDGLSDSVKGSGKGSSFQRVDLEKDGNPPTGFVEGFTMNGEYKRDTKQKAIEIEKQAYLQGFVKGEKAGMELGRKKVEPVLSNFHQALVELDRVKNEISQNAEREAVGLAMAIAKKIVGHEVATNKKVVLEVVKEALKKVVDENKIIVRISPADLQFVRDAKLQFSDYVDNIENIAIEADETIADGGCVIETNLGEIDARIDKQLQAVEEAFRSHLQESTLTASSNHL